ncbi:ligand-dependent nuclear receptor-interacting factor 1 isoform X2 [Lacerta agilis]|uniref:ligand-dependent nuclear receptor-interacting factor 1 isoform X2 n=1 Tax=Lacerta agilis TaxID=80427 RepID=UPI00141A141C|nr:ligand-dependent nuclear receptor-interacting factor 1 isoform X2 [Lacerta agilis]
MSRMPQGAAQSEYRKGEGHEGSGASAASPCVTGHIYKVVHTTGLDGKNLLELLPLSKRIGNIVSLVQPPVISDAKGEDSMSGHGHLKDLFENITPSSFVKAPELKTATHRKLILPKPNPAIPGKLILPKPMENMEVAPLAKENPTTPSASSIHSSYRSADNSLEKDATLVSSHKSSAEYVPVNKKLPVTAKSPVVPSGHHLQIPAHAEVKSVPASFLPPTIQQKILATAASNAYRTCEVANASTVIYVSPVNTVKTHSKPLLNLCPKPVGEVSNSLVLTMAQAAASNSALATSDSLGNQSSPMKWVVEENPQSASCLVPVKSSNSVASNILKTLVNPEDGNNNPASILPTCSNNLNESQGKMPSINDNALVMFNGKVYLLTKKESTMTPASKCGKQVSLGAETHLRKNALQLINSAADNTITNQVVNLVLSKNKGIAPYAKDPKSSENIILSPQSELKNFKVTSPSFTPPHGNVQVNRTSQPEAVSTPENVPAGRNVAKKSVTKERMKHGLQKIISPKVPAAAALQPSTRRGTSEEQDQKMERILAGVAAQIKQRKHRKHCLELRKKFGLHREERVYLQRIPLSVILRKSEATVCSNNVQMSDTCKLPPAVPIKPGPEEEITEEEEEELNIKRKAKMLPIQENTKKQKTEIESIPKPNLECGNSDSVVDNPSSSCTQLVSEQGNPTSILQFSQRVHPHSNLCVQSNEENKISASALHYSEHENPLSKGSFREDFSFNLPDLEETIRDEKIAKLKLMLREREAALEEIRKKMQQT